MACIEPCISKQAELLRLVFKKTHTNHRYRSILYNVLISITTLTMKQKNPSWQFWIDRGGTFTDVIALTPESHTLTRKLLSENPECYQDAAIQAIKDLMGNRKNQQIAAIKMGTTVGTNALLEGKGEKTALLINKGFRDCLKISYQNRPDIFALKIQRPSSLYSHVLEISGRIDSHGQIIEPLDHDSIRNQLLKLHNKGIKSLAIVTMHSWKNPQHEGEIGDIAKDIGFQHISLSHQISPLMKIVARGHTTVIDAYLSPVLKHYVKQFCLGLKENALNAEQLLFMQSNGGLTQAQQFRGKDCILSGPAGGMIGAIASSESAGINHIISFDMGGTSTDVAHYAGELERDYEAEIANIRLHVPMLAIHTVAAGGGSILNFDGQRYRVGPKSAGANPGPAGYRKGGPLTVTDANIMLGKLPLFPKVFGENGNLSLDKEKVETLFHQLAEQIQLQCGDQRTAYQVAEGFIDVAVENMASAIKKISQQKGYQISDYSLCCFGAAAGQHACKVADRLNMKQIVIHPHSGLLSAYGMGLADQRLIKTRSLEIAWNELNDKTLSNFARQLEAFALDEIRQNLDSQIRLQSELKIKVRFSGTNTALETPLSDLQTIKEQFLQHYKQQFGFVYDDKPLIAESISAEIVAKIGYRENNSIAFSGQDGQPVLITQMYSQQQFWNTPVFQRQDLNSQTRLTGPCIVVDTTSTIVIEPGWQLQLDGQFNLILKRYQFADKPARQHKQSVDPVLLEIFNQRFTSIAEQMGHVLQKTAYSVNIKERLDFSCAIFDTDGDLVANAPHIPVHLGSMSDSVKSLLMSESVDIQENQVYLLNSPYHGGTHLPDITVISPVFIQHQLVFFLASRGHHADVGGINPGSMPANSQHISEEGVLSQGLLIVDNGHFLENEIMDWLSNGEYPARNPQQNCADLRAQVAANQNGIQEIGQMVAHFGLDTVIVYMQFIQQNAKHCMENCILNLSNGSFSSIMDDGSRISVKIEIDRKTKKAIIDFSGSSKPRKSNFNAPFSVTKAAVLYVFRTLINDQIPLNEGCLQPLQIIMPEQCFLNCQYPQAVVAGNVETSQMIVDCLYAALGQLAAAQGSMNNFSFGNEDYQYYETICGGTGAGPGFSGCDAIQSHMTNSRMTDAEVLEWRYPVRLEQFSIRENSGGSGKWAGGNGVCRRIKFLEPMTVSILSNHRIYPPWGIAGGQAASCGNNLLISTNGVPQTLSSCCEIKLNRNESIEIQTPGGGGYAPIQSNQQ